MSTKAAAAPARNTTKFPTKPEIAAMFHLKYGHGELDWGPKLRRDFGYFTPADIYETAVWKLVEEGTDWLDVGCGRELFPSNRAAAIALSRKCRLLVGVDPSDNIHRNELLHQSAQCLIEDFQTEHRFDLITARMVAEHVTDPQRFIQALARLCRPGGRVVIYTVYRWSPATLLSWAVPLTVHHFAKRLLWGTKERDTFPTSYLMNTRSTLNRMFSSAGFTEEHFRYLDDCRSFQRWKLANRIELGTWKALRLIGIPYPELCILGIYRNAPAYD